MASTVNASFLFSVGAIAAGAFVMYKAMTLTFGDPDVHPPKALPNMMWSDDNQSALPDNMMGEVDHVNVDWGVDVANVGGALVEVEPETMRKLGAPPKNVAKLSKQLVS